MESGSQANRELPSSTVNQLLSTNGVVPPTNGNVQSTKDEAPSTNGVTPSTNANGSHPSTNGNGMAPSIYGSALSTNGNGAAPSAFGEHISSNSEHWIDAPYSQELFGSSATGIQERFAAERVALGHNGTSTNGLHPSFNGVNASSNGVHPSSNGVNASSNGVHPSSNGVHPSSNGVHPSSNGVHPPSNGVHPPSNGVHPPSNGLHLPSNGVPSSSNGHHSSNGVDSTNGHHTSNGVNSTNGHQSSNGVNPSTDGEFPLELDAVIVGASWSGLWTLYKLTQLGFRAKLLDACSDVGGVWHYTHYPGCRVDTEIPLYEYSMPELYQNWKWTDRFPSSSEIQRYLSWVTEKLDIRKHIILNTRVHQAMWHEGESIWTIDSKQGRIANTRFFVPCCGYTTVPYVPDFPGLDQFPTRFHSSRWPQGFDCENLRVGVVGTGASGIQIIEALAPKAKQLTVFQRTPNLATPMGRSKFTAEDLQRLNEERPILYTSRNDSLYGFHRQAPDRSTFDDPPEDRKESFQKMWDLGGQAFWFSNYPDMLTNPNANKEAYHFWRAQTLPRIQGEELQEKLAPRKPPHAFGTKRPSLEMRYFEVFNRSNVELIDVNKDPVKEITSQGVQSESSFRELDALVFATGFDALTGSMLAFDISGTNGLRLKEKWGNGVKTSYGIAIRGFKNMFVQSGPQAPTALGLTPQMAEIQGTWVAACINWMSQKGYKSVEPSENSEIHWKKVVTAGAMKSLFWETDSFYNGSNIPGKIREPLCFFAGVNAYEDELNRCKNSGYDDFVFT